MIAYDSEAQLIKHFRVDKMLRPKVLDEKRDGSDRFRDFDMAIYSQKTFGMYGGTEETVTLRCKNELAGVIIDRFGQDTVFVQTEKDHFHIHVKVAVSPPFLSWVMTFGSDITILAPESVKAEYIRLARSILEQYEAQ